jgi:regulator of sirC expression with transglutaminase-like and TPR domain
VVELRHLLKSRDENVPLDVAALELATIEFPHLDIPGFIEILDSYARELASLAGPEFSGEDWVAAANEYLFDTLGFTGNQNDYYHPHNSCLNEVLASRTGIPITLSLVYIEIARRNRRPVYGVALSGHFLVKYEDRDFSTYIDCFHQGRLLSEDDYRSIVLRSRLSGEDPHPATPSPASKFQIAVRMLNNLRGVYYQREEYAKALRVLDLLIDASPGGAEEYKQRGVLHFHLHHLEEALADLKQYLKLAPRARDRRRIELQVESLERHLRAAGRL